MIIITIQEIFTFETYKAKPFESFEIRSLY